MSGSARTADGGREVAGDGAGDDPAADLDAVVDLAVGAEQPLPEGRPVGRRHQQVVQRGERVEGGDVRAHVRPLGRRT